ncbi:hypothetical protein Baya_14421 [Bagarius yarrelli]|uniref:Uncharacterized protein n=1 Tax=Bagarius yarrelli TaxID=175774 RepID=A0A556V8K8_BAGYA|nr:hypothetical protein Baya_14421 [Bagarius yarrelli]
MTMTSATEHRSKAAHSLTRSWMIIEQNTDRTEQNRTEQNRTEQTEQNRTQRTEGQNRNRTERWTEQNAGQNRTLDRTERWTEQNAGQNRTLDRTERWTETEQEQKQKRWTEQNRTERWTENRTEQKQNPQNRTLDRTERWTEHFVSANQIIEMCSSVTELLNVFVSVAASYFNTDTADSVYQRRIESSGKKLSGPWTCS